MTILQAAIIGVVEGFTEFLPISSTAHILIVQKIFNIVLDESVTTFTIAVQLGSILAAAILYIRQFFSLRKVVELILTLLPTVIAGILIYPFIKIFFTNVLYIVPWTLVVGGLLMLWGEKIYKKNVEREEKELTLKEKFILGCAQVFALVPGVSRSASMIVTGLFANFPRRAVMSFTFILAVPTMFSATLYDVYKTQIPITALLTPSFCLGFITAFFVALFSIRFMLFLVQKYTFTPFAWYRIVLGISIGLFLYI